MLVSKQEDEFMNKDEECVLLCDLYPIVSRIHCSAFPTLILLLLDPFIVHDGLTALGGGVKIS